MTALVSYLSISYEGVDHTWTAGEDYDTTANDDGTVTLASNAGKQTIPIDQIPAILLYEVFGIEVDA